MGSGEITTEELFASSDAPAPGKVLSTEELFAPVKNKGPLSTEELFGSTQPESFVSSLAKKASGIVDAVNPIPNPATFSTEELFGPKAISAPLMSRIPQALERGGQNVKGAVQQSLGNIVSEPPPSKIPFTEIPLSETQRNLFQTAKAGVGGLAATATELAPFTPSEFAQYIGGEALGAAEPLKRGGELYKAIQEMFPKTAEVLFKERTLLTPQAQGRINSLISNFKQAIGIPQERGLVPYDFQKAIAEGRITESDAARLDQGIYDEMLQVRRKMPAAPDNAPEMVAKVIPEAAAPVIQPNPAAPAEIKVPPYQGAAMVQNPQVQVPQLSEVPSNPSQKVKDFFSNAIEKYKQEAMGQSILDDLSADGVSPSSVAEKFFAETLPKLSENGKRYFKNYIYKNFGYSPDVPIEKVLIGQDKNGKTLYANSLKDLLDLPDSPDAAEGLEGTERGLVALMEYANKNAGKFIDSALVKDSSKKFYHGTTDDVIKIPSRAFLTDDPNEAALYANMRAREKGRKPKIFEVPSSAGVQDETVVEGHLRTNSEIDGKDVTLSVLATDEKSPTPALRAEIIPGSKEFMEQDVIPAIKSAADQIKAVGDDIQKTFAPVTRGDQAKITSGIVRENAAELAMKKERVYAALKSASKIFDKLPKEISYKFIDHLESGQKQNAGNLQPIADQLRKLLDGRREEIRAMGTGKLEHFIEDYFPHIWQDPKKAGNVFSRVFGKRPLEGSKSFLKQRTIPTFKEGLEAGLIPVTDNPVDLALLKIHEMDRYIMGQNIFKEMKEKGLAEFVKFGQKAPEGYVKINDKIARVYQRSEAEKGFIIRGEYYAPEPAARILNNYLSPGLRGNALYDAFRGSGNMMNQVQLGLSAFHLSFTTLDSLISKTALGIRQLSEGQILRGTGSVLSGMDIVTQPIRNYLKGDKVLKAYFQPGSQGAEMERIIDGLIAAGGRVKMDSFYKNSAVESFWKALDANNYPGAALRIIPATIQSLAKPIMEVIVPRQKLGIFFDLAKFELERLGPNATRDQMREVLGRAWDSVDNRLGQLVYDNIFWNKALKDIGLASVRSLGWNIGTIREIGGGAFIDTPREFSKIFKKGQKPEITNRMAYTLALPFIAGLYGAMYQYLMTGKGPQELKDYFFPKTGRKTQEGKEERAALPTYMKDVFAYANNPVQTVGHKLHPLLAALASMLQNKDYYGVKIRDSEAPLIKQTKQLFEFIGSQFIPFSVRNFQKVREDRGSVGKAAQSFFGVTPAPGYMTDTKAERKMKDYLIDSMPSSRSPAEYQRATAIKKAVSDIRNGQAASAISDLRTRGDISPRSIQNAARTARLTPLINGFKHLNVEQAMNVYESATPQEQKSLKPYFMMKVRNGASNFSPEKRKNVMEFMRRMK